MGRIAMGRRARSDRLLEALADYDQLLVVMHDNPDPDAIAAGWAIFRLIQEKLARPVRLVGGGAIVRAENRRMVELLQPPIELVDDFDFPADAGAILVDCSPGTTNQLLTRQAIRPAAVIDHHGAAGAGRAGWFQDVRPAVAASASIAASYLREQQAAPGVKLATAILYGIRTETRGAAVHFSPLDRSMLLWATGQADQELLAEIENAPLPREYFGDLVLAMQSALVYDDVILCFLPRAHGAEIVGEVADLLIRCEGVRRVLCGAVVGDDLLVSVRTQGRFGDATRLLQTTVAGLGRGGGHAHRAGGKIPGVRDDDAVDQLHHELRRRWLTACNVRPGARSRLIARREIVENL